MGKEKNTNTQIFETLPVHQAVATMAIPAIIGQLIINGFGRGKEALFLGVMRWAAFNIPMLFLLNALFGMYGIVFSQVTADVLTVALSLYVYSRFQKKYLR